MAKLKYDRPINMDFGGDRKVTIPNDEVWKVTTKDGNTQLSQKLYGGGTHSAMGLSQASRSSTSRSKRLHGGGAPWLRNLSLIDRLSLKTWAQEVQLCLRMKFGKFHHPSLRVVNQWMHLYSDQPIQACIFLQEDAVLTAEYILPASRLNSWEFNGEEGVTLYA